MDTNLENIIDLSETQVDESIELTPSEPHVEPLLRRSTRERRH